jgi:basic membrane protein A
VLGPVDSPERRKLADSYIAGAKAAKPAVQAYPVQWVGGAQPFDDPARAEQSTRSMLAAGVDVVYTIAGGSNQGALHAVENQGKGKARLIGHPVNQCHMAPGRLLDSVEIHYDTAIALSVNRIMSGSASPRMEFGLKENALALTSISPDGAWSECEASKDKSLLQRLRLERTGLAQGK